MKLNLIVQSRILVSNKKYTAQESHITGKDLCGMNPGVSIKIRRRLTFARKIWASLYFTNDPCKTEITVGRIISSWY